MLHVVARSYYHHSLQVWSKPLVNGDLAVVLYNSNNEGLTTVNVTWSEVCALEPISSAHQ